MLIQFRVENHRSLRDEQTLSLVADSTLDPADPRLIRVPGFEEALLPAVALYGANASGKTNVVRALGFLCEAVTDSQRLWDPNEGTPQEPFMLSDKATEPSLFEVDILLEGKRYRYGFLVGAGYIEEEWLYTYLNGERQSVFEREGQEFKFGEELDGENNEVIASLTRANSLFLSAAAQSNHKELSPIYGWFHGVRFEYRHRDDYEKLWRSHRLEALGNLLAQDRWRQPVIHLLKTADIGIHDVKAEEEEEEIFAWGRRGKLVRRTKLLFMHRVEKPNQEVWLPLYAQSSGTITLLEMAVPLLQVLEFGGLLCIDELEASLHPKLALELLRLFNDPKHNPHGAQLVFTTHDTNLLGNTLGEPPLRRDQIWFTEKDQAGATHLYPLTDFHPKQQENIERGYLQGRYGAIPFLGDLLAKGD